MTQTLLPGFCLRLLRAAAGGVWWTSRHADNDTFFIASRTLGATARLYRVVKIRQDSILQTFGVPFWLTTLVILIMILLYSMQGGVRTIVYTDTLQTAAMLRGLFAFGVFTQRAVRDRWVPPVALTAPALGWVMDAYQRLGAGAGTAGRERGLDLCRPVAVFESRRAGGAAADAQTPLMCQPWLHLRHRTWTSLPSALDCTSSRRP